MELRFIYVETYVMGIYLCWRISLNLLCSSDDSKDVVVPIHMTCMKFMR